MQCTTSLWPAREHSNAAALSSSSSGRAGVGACRRRPPRSFSSDSIPSTSMQCTAWGRTNETKVDGAVGVDVDVAVALAAADPGAATGATADDTRADVREMGGISLVDTHSCLVSATYVRQTIAERDSEAFSADTN
mmetsp:Transcript_3221/g.6951  ORF Transcript_3221/g.6951 Transcript_3221/m.6951 type:complete len:136 (-) Transcript_3221:75-482(-)